MGFGRVALAEIWHDSVDATKAGLEAVKVVQKVRQPRFGVVVTDVRQVLRDAG